MKTINVNNFNEFTTNFEGGNNILVVNGREMRVTEKKRVGTQTRFSGTFGGETFENKTSHQIAQTVCGLKKDGTHAATHTARTHTARTHTARTHTARTTAIEPKHGAKLYNYGDAEGIALKLCREYRDAKETIERIEKFAAVSNFPTLLTRLTDATLQKQKRLFKEWKDKQRFAAIQEQRINIRRQRFTDYQSAVNADMLSGKLPTKQTIERLQQLKQDVENFERRRYMWQVD